MLKDKSAAAAMLNMPFTLRAAAEGLGDLGSAVEALGPYQGTGSFVLRKWAAGNSDVLVRYLQAYIEGLRWGVDPKNQAEAAKLYVGALKLNEAMAARTLAVAAHPTDGLTALRASVMKQGTPPAPEKYLDGSYYAKALAGLQ
jgi:ABC-type nitrate/sulfonate/bicarbonate transport system substrate-binding protein